MKQYLTRETISVIILIVSIVLGFVYVATHKERPGLLLDLISASSNERSEILKVENLSSNITPPNESVKIEEVERTIDTAPRSGTVPVGSPTLFETTEVSGEVPVAPRPDSSGEVAIGVSPVTSTEQRIGQLLTGGLRVERDDYRQNNIYETLTPYATLVEVIRYSVIDGSERVGYIYELKRKDGSIGKVYDFILTLTIGANKAPSVTVRESLLNDKKAFYYINSLANADAIRIVVESNNETAYAFDYPRKYHSDIKGVLNELP